SAARRVPGRDSHGRCGSGGAGRGGGADVRIAGGGRAVSRPGGAWNGVGTGCPARPGATATGDHPAGAGPPALEPAGGGRRGAAAAGNGGGPGRGAASRGGGGAGAGAGPPRPPPGPGTRRGSRAPPRGGALA